VLVLALGFAALRNPLAFWAGFVPFAAQGLVCVAVVGAVCRTGPERAWWLGFALCGLSQWHFFNFFNLVRTDPRYVVLQTLGSMMGIPIDRSQGFPVNDLQRSFYQIGHSLWSLIFATIGGFVGWALFGATKDGSEQAGAGSQPAAQVPARWWVVPSLIVMVGLIVVTAISLACARLAPGLWAGSTYLLTWWMLGLSALGALFGRGRRREFWLGATFFGMGFLLVAFSRQPYDAHEPHAFLPTVRFLEALRPQLGTLLSRLYADSESTAVRNARILTLLERRVPIHFAKDTLLADLLAYIKEATQSPDGKGIPIYVDVAELAVYDKSMKSKMNQLDLEDVELRTSLRLLLKQIDLDYEVRDGLLRISTQEMLVFGWRSIEEDPFQIAGHCFLALVAAALGGLAAPLVCDFARKPAG